MTLKELTERFAAAGIEDAAFDAAQLICHACAVSRAALMCDRDKNYDSPLLESLAARRERGEPLQYILGEWEFMGLRIKVGPDCLIPRADTEVLAQFAIDNLPRGGRFADLCTGSGCIAAAILAFRQDVSGAAAELYPETLEIAKENAETLHVSERLEFIRADVTRDCLTGKFDIIVANPPYIAASEMPKLSREVMHEPRAALTDGGDGLSIIKSIIDIYPARLRCGGTLAVEIGWRQGQAVSEYAEGRGLEARILKDGAGRDRVVCMQAK